MDTLFHDFYANVNAIRDLNEIELICDTYIFMLKKYIVAISSAEVS